MEKNLLTPEEICDAVIASGIKKTSMNPVKMLLLGVLAGAYIALGGFISTMASHGIDNYGLSRFVTGAIFPIGLILVIICGAELFTGNNLISIALYDKKVGIGSMLKNWVIVYAGNFIGSYLTSLLIYNTGILSVNAGKLGGAVLKIASYKGSLLFGNSIASGILCNILVCLAVWGATGARDAIGKIFAIWFPVMAFVTAGFEHSIANMYYFSIGIMAKSNEAFVKASGLTSEKLSSLNWGTAFSKNIIPVTLGNIIGGALVVGLLYWAVYKYSPLLNANKSKTISR